MFHDRKIDNKINKIQEVALRTGYRDNTSQFKELLENDQVSTHQNSLLLLMTEIYKTENRLSPLFMIDIFDERQYPTG